MTEEFDKGLHLTALLLLRGAAESTGLLRFIIGVQIGVRTKKQKIQTLGTNTLQGFSEDRLTDL